MRRYSDRDQLRVLAPARALASEQGSPKVGGRTVEVAEYDFMRATAAMAADTIDARQMRRWALLSTILLGTLGALGLTLYTTLLSNLTGTIDVSIEEELDRRTDELFGVRSLYFMLREFSEEADELIEDDHPSQRQSQELLNRADEIVSLLSNEAGARPAGMTPAELTELRTRLAESIDRLSTWARMRSDYHFIMQLDIISDETRQFAPQFAVNLAYASGIVLLSLPGLQRDLQPGWTHFDLYERHQDALLEVSETFPEYQMLYQLVLERELRADREALASISAAFMQLSDDDKASLASTVAEIGIDGSARPQFQLAAKRVYETFVDGCGADPFIPQLFCEAAPRYLQTFELFNPSDFAPQSSWGQFETGIAVDLTTQGYIGQKVSPETLRRLMDGD